MASLSTQQSQMADQRALLICATSYSAHQSGRDSPCCTHLPSFNTPDYLYGGGAIDYADKPILANEVCLSRTIISLNSFIAQIAWERPLGSASNHYSSHCIHYHSIHKKSN